MGQSRARSSYRAMTKAFYDSSEYSAASYVFEELVAKTEIIGTVGVAATATITAHTQTNLVPFMMNTLPSMGAIQGFFSMARGVYACLDKDHLREVSMHQDDRVPGVSFTKNDLHGDWAPARNRARGIFEFVAGAYLAVESVYPLSDNILGIDPLCFSYAVYSFSQFVLALGDLYSYYHMPKQYRNAVTYDAFWYKTMSNLVGTVLMTAGWLVLGSAMAAVKVGMDNVAGLMNDSSYIFAASTLVMLAPYVPRKWFSFQKDNTSVALSPNDKVLKKSSPVSQGGSP